MKLKEFISGKGGKKVANRMAEGISFLHREEWKSGEREGYPMPGK